MAEDSTKARLTAAIQNGETTVKFGDDVIVNVAATGDYFKVEAKGYQPDGFKWNETTQLGTWEGTQLDDAVQKVETALSGPREQGSKELKVTIEAKDMSLSEIVGQPTVVTKPVEVTENYVRIRARDPGDFQEGTFRTVTLSEEKGIKTVMGRLKGQKTMTIQTYLFDKDKWTEEQARKWVEGQSKKKEGDSKEPGDIEDKDDETVVLLATDGETILGEFTYGENGEYESREEAVAAAQSLKKKLAAELEGKEVVEKALLPLADKGGGWDANAAEARVRKWASSDGSGDKEKMSWSKYGRAFFYYDASLGEKFGAYKLPFADVVGGTLKAVPEGIYAAAKAVMGARTPMKVPLEGPKARIAAYYKKMGEEAPWQREKEKEPILKMAAAVARAVVKRQDNTVTVWREGDERYYMALVSMAIFDDEGQIVEKEGMDCSIGIGKRTGYRSGVYLRHKVPWSLVGRMLYERRIGPFWIEVGRFEDGVLADLAYRALEKDDEGRLKVSIGFITTRDQAKKGRYTRLLKYDTTITDRPALPVTRMFAIGGVGKMSKKRDIAELLVLLNPEEEEMEKATAALSELFGVEEKELAVVVKEVSALEKARVAVEAIEDEDVRKQVLAALEEGAEPVSDDEPKPEPDTAPSVEQIVTNAVTAAMAPFEERLSALESQPMKVVEEISKMLRSRSQDSPRPAGEPVSGVDKVAKQIDKALGGDAKGRHPLAGFVAGPMAAEGG